MRRGNVVLYDCENCAVGPTSISLTRITSFNYFYFFSLLLFLTSIIRSVAMHAFVREGKGRQVRIFLFVHEFKS